MLGQVFVRIGITVLLKHHFFNNEVVVRVVQQPFQNIGNGIARTGSVRDGGMQCVDQVHQDPVLFINDGYAQLQRCGPRDKRHGEQLLCKAISIEMNSLEKFKGITVYP